MGVRADDPAAQGRRRNGLDGGTGGDPLTGDRPGAFRRYATALYGAPGAAAACLALQDRAGADVNILLLCCWHAETGRGVLGADDFRRLAGRVAAWRETVILPLRDLRRRLTADPRHEAQALRERVGACEIDAEFVEQDMLEAETTAAPPSPAPVTGRTAAQASLAAYLEVIDADRAAGARPHLGRLLDAAFPESPHPPPVAGRS